MCCIYTHSTQRYWLLYLFMKFYFNYTLWLRSDRFNVICALFAFGRFIFLLSRWSFWLRPFDVERKVILYVFFCWLSLSGLFVLLFNIIRSMAYVPTSLYIWKTRKKNYFRNCNLPIHAEIITPKPKVFASEQKSLRFAFVCFIYFVLLFFSYTFVGVFGYWLSSVCHLIFIKNWPWSSREEVVETHTRGNPNLTYRQRKNNLK